LSQFWKTVPQTAVEGKKGKFRDRGIKTRSCRKITKGGNVGRFSRSIKGKG